MTPEEAERQVAECLARVERAERAIHEAKTLSEEMDAEVKLLEARTALGRANSNLALVKARYDPETQARLAAKRGRSTPAREAQREAAREKASSPEARKKAWETRRMRQGEKLAQQRPSGTSDHGPG